MACAQRAAGLQLSCCAPGSSPAQLTAVQVGRASARPTTNPAQGAPPPYPCRPAPHAPRRARAHPPCPSHRTIARFAPLSHNSHTRVPTFVHRARRGLSNEVLYVVWVCVFCLKMRCIGKKILPGLRPGPRDRRDPWPGTGCAGEGLSGVVWRAARPARRRVRPRRCGGLRGRLCAIPSGRPAGPERVRLARRLSCCGRQPAVPMTSDARRRPGRTVRNSFLGVCV